MIQHDVLLRSGRRGWRAKLQDNYENKLMNWLEHASTYNLAERLGYDNPTDAWNDNPEIEGSSDPRDFGLSENERRKNLKLSLMELGNKLVEVGYDPLPYGHFVPSEKRTRAITMFTEWVNANVEVRDALEEMGFKWPMVK